MTECQHSLTWTSDCSPWNRRAIVPSCTVLEIAGEITVRVEEA